MQANNLYLRSWLGVVFLPAIVLNVAVAVGAEEDGRIRPYSGNPFYWQYQGEPVLLLGGSKDDKSRSKTARVARDFRDRRGLVTVSKF